jgi:hypothetical protein
MSKTENCVKDNKNQDTTELPSRGERKIRQKTYGIMIFSVVVERFEIIL